MKHLTWLILIFSTLIFSCNRVSEPAEQSVFNTPEWSYDQTIYEINIRQYSHEGTFNAVTDDLPRLKELGAGILWLMPIHPIGEVNRKGSEGSYYSVKDYLDVNPEYGTKEDFRNLVNTAHELGMYVIIDWVANHTAWDNPLTESDPEFYEVDESGHFTPPTGTDWSDVIQLDYSNPSVWEYMIGALRYWVSEFNIDGYRFDVAYMLPMDFWFEARTSLEKIRPVFMLAEAEGPEFHEIFDMTYTWSIHHMMRDIAEGNSNANDLSNLVDNDLNTYPSGAFRMQFTSNHDENSWAGTEFERLGAGANTFAVLTYTLPGMPLIYNGQEMGLNRRLEFFEKDPITWETNSFFDFYKSLNDLRSNNSALHSGSRGGSFQRLATNNDENIYAFIRKKEDNEVLVVLNLSPESLAYEISTAFTAGDFTEFISGTKVNWNNIKNGHLPSWGYRVFYR